MASEIFKMAWNISGDAAASSGEAFPVPTLHHLSRQLPIFAFPGIAAPNDPTRFHHFTQATGLIGGQQLVRIQVQFVERIGNRRVVRNTDGFDIAQLALNQVSNRYCPMVQVGVASRVLERQDGNGGPVGRPRGCGDANRDDNEQEPGESGCRLSDCLVHRFLSMISEENSGKIGAGNDGL